MASRILSLNDLSTIGHSLKVAELDVMVAILRAASLRTREELEKERGVRRSLGRLSRRVVSLSFWGVPLVVLLFSLSRLRRSWKYPWFREGRGRPCSRQRVRSSKAILDAQLRALVKLSTRTSSLLRRAMSGREWERERKTVEALSVFLEKFPLFLLGSAGFY